MTRFLLPATTAGLAMALWLTTIPAHGQLSSTKPPETFLATAQALGHDAGLTAVVTIHINQYTSDRDRSELQEALRLGGYPRFLAALRAAPVIGSIEMNERKVSARWARQEEKDGGGRTISVVADEPLYFVGGGNVDAKPREGYELTIIQLDVDPIGLGSGSLAAAARVKPGGPTGVQVDDYAQKPIALVTVRKAY